MANAFAAALASASPGEALCAWLKTAESPPLFLEDAAHIPAGPRPYHSGSLLEHMARCMNAVAGDELAVWMALAHDAGKLTTPRCLLPHHYGHELRGAILAGIWAGQLSLSRDFYLAGRLAALWHMRAGRYDILRPGKKYRLLQAVQTTPYADAFWKVVDADRRERISALACGHWRLLNSREHASKSESDKICLLRE